MYITSEGSLEQKIMKLEAKVKLPEERYPFLKQQAFVADKKAIIFDMMIDSTEKEYQTLIFACYLFGVDRCLLSKN